MSMPFSVEFDNNVVVNPAPEPRDESQQSSGDTGSSTSRGSAASTPVASVLQSSAGQQQDDETMMDTVQDYALFATLHYDDLGSSSGNNPFDFNGSDVTTSADGGAQQQPCVSVSQFSGEWCDL